MLIILLYALEFFDEKNIVVLAVDATVVVKEPKAYMQLGNRYVYI